MLTALIIISLLSLLIATEAEPTNAPIEAAQDQPMRPKSKPCCGSGDSSDRMAA